MNLYLIPHGRISNYVNQIIPYLGKIVDSSAGEYTVDYWMGAIFSNSQTLWLLLDYDEIVHGVFLTSFQISPTAKNLYVHAVSTEDHIFLDNQRRIMDTFYKWSADNKCSGMAFEGRPGWQKPMKTEGFKIVTQTMLKKFGASNA
jgi:hypothetical protein